MINRLKEILNNNKKVIWIIESIICIIGFNMTIDTAENLINFNGNQIAWIMLCVFFYFIFKYSSNKNNKRLAICSIILGIMLHQSKLFMAAMATTMLLSWLPHRCRKWPTSWIGRSSWHSATAIP